MNKEDICYMPVYEMVDKINTQELSSLEITEILIERIEKINPIINAYCIPTFELARDQAKIADEMVKRGERLGLLHGVPISIKDSIAMEGIRTTWGSKFFEKNIPKKDDILVRRLRDAGCVILGKTNMPEFGFKGVTDNQVFGSTKNPWNLKMTSGGSSGGAAAAVASGISPLALGGDGGGSIRIPCSFCGTFGIKPHYGRVPSLSLKSGTPMDTFLQKGPITRYVKDSALMLDVIAGPDEFYRNTLPKQDISYFKELKKIPRKLKIGYSLDLGLVKAIEPEVEKSVLDAVQKLENLEWSVDKSKIKLSKAESIFTIFWTTGYANILNPFLKQGYEKSPPELIELVKDGLKNTFLDIQIAGIQRENLYEAVCKQFTKFDLLITPTLACTAFELGKNSPEEIDGKTIPIHGWLLTYPFNLTDHPAASIPCGWSSNGLPIGMQIIGKRFDEVTVLQVAKAFEDLAPWQDKRPKI